MATTSNLRPQLTAISDTEVALSGIDSTGVQIYDIDTLAQTRRLPAFPGRVWGSTLLGTDELAVVSQCNIYVGSPVEWTPTVYVNDSEISCIIGALDGSFVTHDISGNVKVWQNGKCVATCGGAYHTNVSHYYGISLAVGNGRIVSSGVNNDMLVFE